jgi:hypothetical protein
VGKVGACLVGKDDKNVQFRDKSQLAKNITALIKNIDYKKYFSDKLANIQ